MSATVGPHAENGKSIVFAGTEPSSIYRSTDDGAMWEDLAGLRDVPSYDTWFFPPRPETHHVRWIAPHAFASDGQRWHVRAWCHENGGHCDCEVLFNCEERWQDAKHDVNR